MRRWIQSSQARYGMIFLGLAIALGAILILAAAIIAVRNPDPEKVSAYECGFNAFDDARMKFDVRFYLVAILFIIFDLEIAFLFPWAVGGSTPLARRFRQAAWRTERRK